jgi:hypothetical protein
MHVGGALIHLLVVIAVTMIVDNHPHGARRSASSWEGPRKKPVPSLGSCAYKNNIVRSGNEDLARPSAIVGDVAQLAPGVDVDEQLVTLDSLFRFETSVACTRPRNRTIAQRRVAIMIPGLPLRK